MGQEGDINKLRLQFIDQLRKYAIFRGQSSMSSLNELLYKRSELSEKIRNIEIVCEGIENEHNAEIVADLNIKQTQLMRDKTSLAERIKTIESELGSIFTQINSISGTGNDKIINSLKKQRWYFFKNNPKVIFDRDTGVLWPNLTYFKGYYAKDFGEYSCGTEVKQLSEFNKTCNNGFTDWCIPTKDIFVKMIKDKSFPFQKGDKYYILEHNDWFCKEGGFNVIHLNDLTLGETSAWFLPCNLTLCVNDYESNVSAENKIFSITEKMQLTLNIFINNQLEPIFNDEEVTIIYKKVYIEKPKLLNELTKIQEDIDNLQQEVLLSSTFDYSALLSKYDPVQLKKSVFKYCDAIKSTMEDLINMLSYFESEKSDMISEFNSIGLILSKKYENSSNLTAEENLLFEKRQLYFKKHFEIGMEDVRKQLLSIKNQAEQIEDRIDQINSGENIIRDLAILEKEERASFNLIVENAGNLIKNALIKIEFFESNKEFASAAIRWWDQWADDYKIFKTTLKEELKSSCEDENIECEVYSVWYAEWEKKRLAIEERLLPLIDFGLRGHLIDCNGDDITTIDKVVQMLKEYKMGVDRFYLEERKSIHQKFAFQVGGDLQEKLESESELYKLISNLQSELQNTIFSLSNAEDKLFLLKWAEVLLNLQIDEVLEFINDRELSSITNEILIEFSDLKQKNFETYISDSRAYSEEAQRREKEYNSLIFKMRKELMKQ